MTLRNLLQPRGVANEDQVERYLRTQIASERCQRRASQRIFGRRRTAVLAGGIVAIGSIGTAAAAALGVIDLGYIQHFGSGKSFPVSTNLRMSIIPNHGPTGTVVTLHITGCFDPSGNNHAVGYNAAASAQLNTMGMTDQYPNAMSTVPVTQTGGDLTGTFKVAYAPVHTGQFFVQCGASFTQAMFTVTDVPLTNTIPPGTSDSRAILTRYMNAVAVGDCTTAERYASTRAATNGDFCANGHINGPRVQAWKLDPDPPAMSQPGVHDYGIEVQFTTAPIAGGAASQTSWSTRFVELLRTPAGWQVQSVGTGP